MKDKKPFISPFTSNTYSKVNSVMIASALAAHFLSGPLAGGVVLLIGLPLPILVAGWLER